MLLLLQQSVKVSQSCRPRRGMEIHMLLLLQQQSVKASQSCRPRRGREIHMLWLLQRSVKASQNCRPRRGMEDSHVVVAAECQDRPERTEGRVYEPVIATRHSHLVVHQGRARGAYLLLDEVW